MVCFSDKMLLGYSPSATKINGYSVSTKKKYEEKTHTADDLLSVIFRDLKCPFSWQCLKINSV